MKYFSEKLNKVYNSEAECQAAEMAFDAEQKAKAEREAAIKEQENKVAIQTSKRKKELAKAVDDAEAKVAKAYEDYEVVKEEIKKLTEEYNKKISDLTNPAKEAITQAQRERFQAISEFNKEFGAYTTIYSGNRALEEMKRANSWINDIFNGFFF